MKEINYYDEDDNLHIFDSYNDMIDYINSEVIPANFVFRNPRTKESAYKILDRGGSYLIKFKKISDGSIRYMMVTRDWDKLSKDKVRGYIPPSGKSNRTENPYQVIVWDLGKNGFRSFRIDTLISMDKISNDLVSYYNINIDMDMNHFLDLLDNNDLVIRYKKLDNSFRLMRCTRSIYGDFPDPDSDLIKVWDYDKQDYRNIIFENVYRIVEINKVKQSRMKDWKNRIKNLFR